MEEFLCPVSGTSCKCTEREKKACNDLLDESILDLNLTARSHTVLRNLNVFTIKGLKNLNIENYRGKQIGFTFPWSQGIYISDKVVNEIKTIQKTFTQLS